MTTSATMADDHKLISTPVSIADGFKRGDRNTWKILLVAAAVAAVIVIMINVFVEKPPPIRWPSTAPSAPAEPRTYDVAPPGSAPSQPQPRSK